MQATAGVTQNKELFDAFCPLRRAATGQSPECRLSPRVRAASAEDTKPDQAVSKLLAAADDQLNKQRWDDAIASCTEALRLQADNFDAFSKRAVAWSQKGDIEKALGDFDSALKIKPASPVELVIRSGLYIKKRCFDLATRDLSAAIKFDPSFATDALNSVIEVQKSREPLRSMVFQSGAEIPHK